MGTVWSTLLLLACVLGDGDLTEDFESAGSEGWERIASDAYPPFNIVERIHDPEQAKSGNQYLHFRTLGGSTAVRRSARHPWPVEPSRPYGASVWVRLSGTRNNSAFLSLTWVNASGVVLAETRSEPVRRTEGWTRQTLDVSLSPAGATGVLPGLHFEGPDVRGSCDFDLLELVPTELLAVHPASRSMAIFTTEEYPRFVIRPAGLPSGVHSISATMISPDGKSVHRSTRIDFPSVRTVAVDFPPLDPGIQQLKASIDGRDVSTSLAALVSPPGWAPGPAPLPEDSAGRSPEPAAVSLQRHLLDPRQPVVLDRRFFDSTGNPTVEYFALRIADQLLFEATPIPDPGLFPADVRVAAFRKGASVLFAVWSEGIEHDLALPIQEGALLGARSIVPRPFRGGERVRVGSMPLFLLDVDPVVTELGIDLSASVLPLQLDPTRLTMRLRNRSRRSVPRDLQISLDGLPAGWRASTQHFRTAALQPDSAYEEAFDLIVPPSESERSVDLKFGLGFTIRGKEMLLQLSRQISLRSPIRIESGLRADPSKTLSVRILNGSDHAMTLSVRSRIPGLAERLDLIRDLAPGSRTRAFEFPGLDTGIAEILVQEAGGNRAVARLLLPLR